MWKRSLTRSSYYAMLGRCYNPNHVAYGRYGGAGITVCERWRGEQGYAAFLDDLGERPSREYTIDRFPDTCGNYEPSNCRWATRKQQARNRRNNLYLTHGSQRLLLVEWGEIRGIPAHEIRRRLRKLGWTVEKALDTPYKTNGKSPKKRSSLHAYNDDWLAVHPDHWCVVDKTGGRMVMKF